MNPMMGAVGIGTSLLGSLFGASGAMQSGAAQSGEFMYKAGLAQMNAQIAEQNSNYSIAKGEQEAGIYGMQARQKAGQIKADQGAGGLDVNSGSNLAVQQSQHTVSQMDLNTIRTNAAKVAYDYRVQAEEFRSEAAMDMIGAMNSRSAARTNAMASLIGGASSVADKWLKGNEVGLWGSGDLMKSGGDLLQSAIGIFGG